MPRVGLVLAAVLMAAAPAAAEPGREFPSVKAETLAKAKVTLPDDFAAARNVILVSFGRDMQQAVDAWDAALAPFRSDGRVEVYNTPLIPNPGALVRGFITGGMRSVYTDDAARRRVIVLFVDEESYFPALGVTARDAPLVIVTDRAGVELGRVQAPLGDAALSDVRALIEN
jgi:hypothetical protein